MHLKVLGNRFARFFLLAGCMTAAGIATATEQFTGWTHFGGLTEGCNGAVHATAWLPDGRVVLGGDFTLCGSAAASGVAIWDPSLPGFTTLGQGASSGVSGRVYALTVDGRSLWVGGSFENAGGQPANHIARWDAATDTWHSISVGSNIGLGLQSARVTAIAVDGPVVYLGGSRITAPGLPTRGIARWHQDRNEWSLLPPGSVEVFNDSVGTLLIHNRYLYIGGQFGLMGGDARGIARWSLDREVWQPIRGGSITSGQWVSELLYHQGAIYAAGLFNEIGEKSASNIARLDVLTEQWEALGPPGAEGTSDHVSALALVGDDLIAAGRFTSVGSGSLPSERIARFRLDTQTWLPVSPGLPERVRALLPLKGAVLVAGDFRDAGDRLSRYVATWRIDDDSWSSLAQLGGNGIDGKPAAIAADAEGLYVAGMLWTSDGSSRQPILAWSNSTGDWEVLGDFEIAHPVGLAVAIVGSDVFLGGSFPFVGGGTSYSVGRWSRPQGRWFGLSGGVLNSPHSGGAVYALAPGPNGVTVGGSFRLTAGQPAANLANWQGYWQPLSVASSDNSSDIVHALTDGGDEVFAGGGFTIAGSIQANRIARWHRISGVWSTLGAAPDDGVDGPVSAIAVDGSWVYVVGAFSSAGGVPANGVARWNRQTNEWQNLGTDAPEGIASGGGRAIAVIGPNVYVGGELRVPGYPLFPGQIARWNTNTETWYRLDDAEVDGPVTGLASRGGNLYMVGEFRSVGGETSSGIARWTLDPRSEDWLFGDGFEGAR